MKAIGRGRADTFDCNMEGRFFHSMYLFHVGVWCVSMQPYVIMYLINCLYTRVMTSLEQTKLFKWAVGSPFVWYQYWDDLAFFNRSQLEIIMIERIKCQ